MGNLFRIPLHSLFFSLTLLFTLLEAKTYGWVFVWGELGAKFRYNNFARVRYFFLCTLVGVSIIVKTMSNISLERAFFVLLCSIKRNLITSIFIYANPYRILVCINFKIHGPTLHDNSSFFF